MARMIAILALALSIGAIADQTPVTLRDSGVIVDQYWSTVDGATKRLCETTALTLCPRPGETMVLNLTGPLVVGSLGICDFDNSSRLIIPTMPFMVAINESNASCPEIELLPFTTPDPTMSTPKHDKDSSWIAIIFIAVVVAFVLGVVSSRRWHRRIIDLNRGKPVEERGIGSREVVVTTAFMLQNSLDRNTSSEATAADEMKNPADSVSMPRVDAAARDKNSAHWWNVRREDADFKQYHRAADTAGTSQV